ncbi:MAG: class I adenylate-forming enzyme family protein [Mycobacteriales bacterium]
MTRVPATLPPAPAGLAPVAPPTTLPALLDAAARRAPTRTAVLGRAAHPWSEWRRDTASLASALQRSGIGRGDVVALHLPNSYGYLVLHAALAALGAVTMPLHLAWGRRELELLLDQADAVALAVPDGPDSDGRAAYWRELCGPRRRLLLVDDEVLDSPDGPDGPGSGVDSGRGRAPRVSALIADGTGRRPDPVTVSPEDPLALLTSSGTTSMRPKACLHTHGGLLGNAAAVAADCGALASDVLISASPFTHAFGLLSVHLSLVTGGCQALLPRWDAAGAAALVARSGATVLFAVPAQLRDLLAYTTDPAVRLLLREVRTGGAPVPAELVRAVRRRFGARVCVQWGMSEVGAGCYTRPDDDLTAADPRSIGRPCTGGQARVRDGELWYRSAYQFRGYLGDPELTAATVTPDGWIRTGDLAEPLPGGAIAYVGRTGDTVNRGGLKFSLVEVETLLSDLPQLDRWAVVAMPDSRLGERAALLVTLRPGATLTLDDVRTHLAGKGLATYKWPEEVVVVDEIPVTPTGKVARGRLRSLLAGERRF